MKQADGWVIHWYNKYTCKNKFLTSQRSLKYETEDIDEAFVFNNFESAMSALLIATYDAGQEKTSFNSGYRVRPFEYLPPQPKRRLLNEED